MARVSPVVATYRALDRIVALSFAVVSVLHVTLEPFSMFPSREEFVLQGAESHQQGLVPAAGEAMRQ